MLKKRDIDGVVVMTGASGGIGRATACPLAAGRAVMRLISD
ncbi:MAG TPA: hypothetical protein VK920_02330 [Solirubrobacterales bacterium]|nr:hypothetical protein [Solirubrobacterales bacterium]